MPAPGPPPKLSAPTVSYVKELMNSIRQSELPSEQSLHNAVAAGAHSSVRCSLVAESAIQHLMHVLNTQISPQAAHHEVSADVACLPLLSCWLTSVC
jgi:hypothetical protein